jgi:hypothetical protein
MPEETHIQENGWQIELGQEVSIEGTLPNIHLKGAYHGLKFEFDLDVTDQASWFIKTPIYDHFSLLSKFKGQLEYQGQTTLAEGLCTYEYARAAGTGSVMQVHTLSRLNIKTQKFKVVVILNILMSKIKMLLKIKSF